jgi:hypothetical protein
MSGERRPLWHVIAIVLALLALLALNLALLAGAVWVVVTVLQAMGVL